MKLLHTSDWHLGAADGDRPLLEDQRFFIDAICDVITRESIDAVLIAGDVYDRSVASAEAVKLYDYAVTRICKDLGVPVLAIAGNHDGAERLASCNALLAGAGLYLAGIPERAHAPVLLGDCEFFLLPWITEETVKSLYPGKRESIKSLEDAYRTALDDMRTHFTPGKRHIVLSHAYVTGSETSVSDRAAEIGHATQIPATVFEGFDYAALGHIHKPQTVAPGVRYSGTPMPFAFGKEEAQVKSVTVVDTGTMTITAVPLPLKHRRTTLTGTLEELLHPVCDEETRTGYVRLQVTDCYLGLETLRDLKGVYPNYLEANGKQYENENSAITMTMEEFAELEADPAAVFKVFCSTVVGEAPDEHLLQLFDEAVASAEREEDRI